jgi:hypothetical protein
VSLWTLVYDDPRATIERVAHVDPYSGITREAFLWDCACGARAGCATLPDAKAEVTRHRTLVHEGHQVTVWEAIEEAEARG